MTHVTPVRAAVAAAAGALALGAMAGTATATRPATTQEINGIVAAVNTYTTARGYTNSRYITDQIRISTQSTSPLYAAAQIDPTPPNRRTIPVSQVLLSQPAAAGAPWQVVDSGSNFCGEPGVPAAVIRDLFAQVCGGGGGGGGGGTVTTLAASRVGPLRAVLQATRGSGSRATVQLTLYRNGVEIGEPVLGVQNGFVWSQLRRPRAGFISLNPALGYVGAQVLVNPTSLYQAYQFKVTAFGWQEVSSPATP